jgi:hypothetical protein
VIGIRDGDGRAIVRTRAAFYLKTSRSLIKLIAHVAVRREWRILVFGPPRDQRRGIQDGLPAAVGCEVGAALVLRARLELCSLR